MRIKPLKTKIKLNYIYRFSSYRAINTPRVFLVYSDKETSHLILHRKIIVVCSEIHLN
jgi:hypothetical protein